MTWFTKKPTDTQAELAELAGLLTQEGWRVDAHVNGIIRLKIDGGVYLIAQEKDDKGFYQIAFPGVYSAPNASIDSNVLKTMRQVNETCKFVKCHLVEETVHIVIQVLASSPKEVIAHFARYISALKYGSTVFWEGVKQK
ncbi:hypothetical protein GJ698_22080 [Pseudoduganella sp. FT26W]|uniref:YbjN domain-containing protein n=1 Tax=Duganella aquatilis TaxID=2666082 RepID=A0A844D1S0_9BURK|nr:hypothetical protein [Duganella aquatilis]MRW86763.1 hypothetical protein [Duganella aquatilis]